MSAPLLNLSTIGSGEKSANNSKQIYLSPNLYFPSVWGRKQLTPGNSRKVHLAVVVPPCFDEGRIAAPAE